MELRLNFAHKCLRRACGRAACTSAGLQLRCVVGLIFLVGEVFWTQSDINRGGCILPSAILSAVPQTRCLRRDFWEET